MTEKPYPQNHPHYIQGVYAERERIIALLTRSHDGAEAMSEAVEFANPATLIDLINKGENE